MQILTTDKIQAGLGVKVLVYGSAGIGKTMLCATCPSPIILSAESGLLSLKEKNLKKVFGEKYQPSPIPVIQISNINDLYDAYNWITKSSDAKSIQTVCLDSLSEIGEVVLNNSKEKVKDPRQAYGELIEKMDSLIRSFRDIPEKHVYMAAKMEPSKDELTGVVKYGPSMPGAKLAQKLPYFFDEVFRFGIQKDPKGVEYRFLQTQPDFQFEAKDRSGCLDKLEFPYLENIFKKIKDN